MVSFRRHARHEFSGSESRPTTHLENWPEVIDDSLEKIGIAKENRIFSPHLTLARARGGSGAPGRHKGDKPNRQFAKLQEFLAKRPAPEFGSMTAREFFLYRSQLSSQGSQYTKIARIQPRRLNHVSMNPMSHQRGRRIFSGIDPVWIFTGAVVSWGRRSRHRQWKHRRHQCCANFASLGNSDTGA